MTTLGNGIVIDEITWNSPNYSPGRPNGIIGATIHWWGLPEWKQNFNQVADYLSTPRGSSSTSAHYVVSDTRVACLVSPTDRAWHALAGNEQTFGLELDPNGGAATLENACQVIAMLEEHFGKSLNVYPHNYWTATQCPGHYASKIDQIVNRVNEIRAGKGTPLAKPETATATSSASTSRTADAPHWVVSKGDSLSKIARYYYGKAGKEELDKLVKHNGLKSANSLSVGQKIYIPGPLVWTVEKGDTWDSVARYYGYDVNYLKSLNAGVSFSVGTVLKIW